MNTDRQGGVHADDIVEALNGAGLEAARDDRDGLPSVVVVNPALTSPHPDHCYPLLSERITLRHANGDRWLLWWSWGEVLGPAADVTGTVDRVARVLGHTVVAANA
jgi:hypothetical protein